MSKECLVLKSNNFKNATIENILMKMTNRIVYILFTLHIIYIYIFSIFKHLFVHYLKCTFVACTLPNKCTFLMQQRNL